MSLDGISKRVSNVRVQEVAVIGAVVAVHASIVRLQTKERAADGVHWGPYRKRDALITVESASECEGGICGGHIDASCVGRVTVNSEICEIIHHERGKISLFASGSKVLGPTNVVPKSNVCAVAHVSPAELGIRPRLLEESRCVIEEILPNALLGPLR